jgi:hypothetical protein
VATMLAPNLEKALGSRPSSCPEANISRIWSSVSSSRMMTSSMETPFRTIGVGVGPAGSGVSVGSGVKVIVGTGDGEAVGLAVGTAVARSSPGRVEPADWPSRTTGVALPPVLVIVGAGSSVGIKTARVGKGWREVQAADRVRIIPMNGNQSFVRPDIKQSTRVKEGSWLESETLVNPLGGAIAGDDNQQHKD